MNQTADASAHLDLDALADVLAGEGAAAAAGHLTNCPSCTSRLGELQAADARVVAVLSTLPPPVVPDDLAERLSAALAAEAPFQPARASVTALPAAAPPRRRTWLPAAAAAVLLASGAGIGWSLLQGGGASDDDSASQAAGAEVVVSASGTDYADEAAVAAALPGVLAGGSATALAAPGAAAESGDAARSEDSAGSTEAEAPAATMAVIDPLERLRTPDGLADCLVSLQATPDEAPLEPLAVDYAMYDGAPAMAVVLLDPDPTKLSVFVVGPECAQADATVLHYVRVDAP